MSESTNIATAWTLKPPLPDPAPRIEVFPGVHATLLSDYDRYGNGSIPFGGVYMKAHGGGRLIGEIGASGGGEWIFKIENATYSIDMKEAFAALEKAHIESL